MQIAQSSMLNEPPRCSAPLKRSALAAFMAEQEPQTIHYDNYGAALVSDDANGEWNPAEKGKTHEHGNGAQRNNEILPDDSPGPLAKTKGRQKVFQPIMHQHDVRLFE